MKQLKHVNFIFLFSLKKKSYLFITTPSIFERNQLPGFSAPCHLGTHIPKDLLHQVEREREKKARRGRKIRRKKEADENSGNEIYFP